MRLLLAFSSLLLIAAGAAVQSGNSSKDKVSAKPAPAALPLAAQKPVAELLHGTRIVDNYRWLEDGASAETQKFVADEMAYTRSILDPLPGREEIHRRLTELLSIGSITAPQIAGRYYFFARREGMQNQPVLYVRAKVEHEKSVTDSAEVAKNGDDFEPDRVLVDANSLAADGTVALDWFEPSEAGRFVAYGTSASGSEMSTLHIIETRTGRILDDTIERTRAASIAWRHDNHGFYYTRYPKKGEVADGQEVYNRHVFYHELGTDPKDDQLIFGEGRDPQEWPSVSLSNDGRWLLIHVSEGWTKSELFLMDTKSGHPPSVVTRGKNFLYSGTVFATEAGAKLYITTNEDAPRYRVFVTDAEDFDRENWKEIIPQSDAVLQGVAVYGGKLFAQYEQNAASRLKIFELDGAKNRDVELPGLGSIFSTTGRHDRDEFFFGYQSFTVPPTIYRVKLKQGKIDPKTGPDMFWERNTMWATVDAPSIDPSAYVVLQDWFKSKDGTRVPMFIVGKKGPDGLINKNAHNPTLLTAYGGFNVSLTPSFSRTAYLWMERGGVYAVANLRGGAEFGEDWHRAGMLEKKQNVFDDMIGAAEHLIAEKYTDKNHLAIQGGSNGGLLMGAMMTQRPDLFRAVVCQVPLLDMLHYQNFQIAKLWIPEYGSAENPEQFKWLYAYSPYHHVKAGVEYPAILFMTADTDTRVDPMHAKKMAARMQAEARNGSSKTRPILLRIESKAGHGAGKPVAKQIEEFTDVYSFLWWQVGGKAGLGDGR